MNDAPQTRPRGRGPEQYHALLQVSASISEHRDLTGLLQDLARRLPWILPVNFIGLVLHVPERNVMAVGSVGMCWTFRPARASWRQGEKSRWTTRRAAGAAARLGMKRTTLLSKMKKLGISRPS